MAIDESERKHVKGIVQMYIGVLRHGMAVASDLSDAQDIPINRSFIEKALKFIMLSCAITISSSGLAEWLTQITGTVTEGNDVVFTNDEELVHAISRVSDLRLAVFDSMKNGGVKTVINSL